MKKLVRILILAIAISLLFSILGFAFTAIDSRTSIGASQNYSYRVTGTSSIFAQSATVDFFSNAPIKCTFIEPDNTQNEGMPSMKIVYSQDFSAYGNPVITTLDYNNNSNARHTKFLFFYNTWNPTTNTYYFNGFIASYTTTWADIATNMSYYPVGNILRTNFDVFLYENDIVQSLYYSQDSGLSLIPIQQKQLDVLNSLYVVVCFVIFVILPLCGLIWFLKRLWFVFL